MTEYPHWHKRTIHGLPWYRRIGWIVREFLRLITTRKERP